MTNTPEGSANRRNPPIGIDACHCSAMRKAARRISRMYDSYLRPTGLRATQFLILAALDEREGAVVHELAERLDIERTAMGKMVGFLERDGFVRIDPSPTDGRARTVELTADGRNLHDRAALLWSEAQRQFSELNGAENVSALDRSLAEMKVDEGAALS
jgi:DNA-binding MarR family transcriptional regulator